MARPSSLVPAPAGRPGAHMRRMPVNHIRRRRRYQRRRGARPQCPGSRPAGEPRRRARSSWTDRPTDRRPTLELPPTRVIRLISSGLVTAQLSDGPTPSNKHAARVNSPCDDAAAEVSSSPRLYHTVTWRANQRRV